MTDDEFFDRLRSDAAGLRYEPADPATWTRLQARIRDRIAAPTVADLLAGWMRMTAASVSVLALLATLTVAWMERQPATVEADPVYEISMAGEAYSVGE